VVSLQFLPQVLTRIVVFPLQERLQVAEIAVANARANPSRASIFVDKTIALEMLMHEDNLTMVLAPYLHGNRYTCHMTLTLQLTVKARL